MSEQRYSCTFWNKNRFRIQLHLCRISQKSVLRRCAHSLLKSLVKSQHYVILLLQSHQCWVDLHAYCIQVNIQLSHQGQKLLQTKTEQKHKIGNAFPTKDYKAFYGESSVYKQLCSTINCLLELHVLKNFTSKWGSKLTGSNQKKSQFVVKHTNIYCQYIKRGIM